MTRHILIDADPIVYRAAYSKESDTIASSVAKLNQIFKDIIFNVQMKCGSDIEYKAYLTGKGNFRHDVAKDYKANRPAEKPPLLNMLREYVLDNYNTTMTEGEEADDAIAIKATELYPKAVIVSIDKDFMQVPGTIYNPMRDEWYEVDEFGGLLSFYKQLLVGDRVDNIQGIWKVGPSKAAKILEGATTELELWQRCLEAYEGDYDRAVMNGRLLWLRRKENQLWEPPEAGATDRV